MIYVERKNINNSYFYYHTKGIRLGNKIKKIRRYIGKDKDKAYSKPEILFSVNTFLDKEYDSLIENYNLDKLSYSKNVIKNIIRENSIIQAMTNLSPKIKEEIEKEFPIEFIYNSNNIEGSKLPLNEVRKIITGKKSKYKNRNEILEAKNSIKAYKFIYEDFKFDLKSIKKLYSILTKELKDEHGNSYTQGFKDVENVVGSRNFETTHPSKVKTELKSLLKWYNRNKKKKFSPELAFNFYFKFEKIHPFVDGNGRTGRLIMNKILKDNKYQPMIIYSKNVDTHLNAFAKGRTKSIKLFLDFMFKRYRANFDEFYQKYI